MRSTHNTQTDTYLGGGAWRAPQLHGAKGLLIERGSSHPNRDGLLPTGDHIQGDTEEAGPAASGQLQGAYSTTTHYLQRDMGDLLRGATVHASPTTDKGIVMESNVGLSPCICSLTTFGGQQGHVHTTHDKRVALQCALVNSFVWGMSCRLSK